LNNYFIQALRVLIVLFLCFILGNKASAKDETEDELFFDKKINYDIYIESGDRVSTVIENVKIVRFEEIKGREFIVVESSGFRLKDESGYILFDSVLAILPQDHFRVHTSPSQKGKVVYSHEP